MADRFSFISKVFIRLCLLIFIIIISACEAVVPETAQTPLPTCHPDIVINPYQLHPVSDRIKDIYAQYKNGGFDSQAIARQDAFSQLGKNMQRWSDYNDIVIDDTHMIRIGVTYLDPVLVQYIILNHALNYQNSMMDTNAFNNYVQTALNNLAQRNEMLFVVAITSPSYNTNAYSKDVLYVNIAIEKLTLTSAFNTQIKPSRFTLGKNLNITHGPVYGVVNFPVSVLFQGGCTGITDQWTDTLTLNSEPFSLGEANIHAQSWSIAYHALILEDDYHPVPTLDPAYNTNRFYKSDMPPTPNINPALQLDDMNSKIYWEEMARYIWNKVIIESAH